MWVILLAVLITFIILLLIVLWHRPSRDQTWVRADGDFQAAQRALGGDTRRDHLRNARIYMRTLQNEGAEPEGQARAVLAYEQVLHGEGQHAILAAALEDIFVGMIGELTPAAALHHTAMIQQNAEDVATGALTRDEYLQQAQEWVTDGENVHDNKLSADLRNVLANCRKNPPITEEEAILECYNFIFDCDLAEPRKAAALNVLRTIAESGANSTYNSTEPRVLADVWSQARKSPNSMEAVVIGLADGQRESGGIVCSTGRLARVVGALSGIDEEVGDTTVMTAKAYRDAAFADVQRVLAREIAKAPPHIKAAMEGRGEVDETAPDYLAFRAGLKKEIDSIVDALDTKFRADELERLRQECYVVL